MLNPQLTILGAGSWGTALAIQAAKKGYSVMLWGHNEAHVAELATARENKQYLTGAPFPALLSVTAELSKAAAFSPLILLAVPSHAFKHTLLNLQPQVNELNLQIAWATKGFNPNDGALLHQVVADIFSPKLPAAVLSGPSFAGEVAASLPTAITIASTDTVFAARLAELFHSDRLRIYTSPDIIGVEVGGAVKNVLAIAAGIADGLGFGANTRAALITRGLSEISRLGIQLGGKQDTFIGLAGLGDLVLTCTDDQSRNRRLGIGLGSGKSIAEIKHEIGQEIEGINTTKETYLLAKHHHVDMPIVEQTYKVLYENLSPLLAVENLLTRDLKAEL